MLFSFDWHRVFPIYLVWTFKNGFDCRYLGFTSFDKQKIRVSLTAGDFLKEKIFVTAQQFVHVTCYFYDVTYFDLVGAIVDIDFCCYMNRL